MPSHKEIIESYQKASKGYHEKECFYTVLLVLLVLAFMGVKMFPQCFGLLPKAEL